jgi:hypothetical protein
VANPRLPSRRVKALALSRAIRSGPHSAWSNFDAEKKRLDIEIDFKTSGRFMCPERGKADCAAYDTAAVHLAALGLLPHQW